MAQDNQTIKTGDRVLRVNTAGPLGTVQKIRRDTTRTTIVDDARVERGTTIVVLWDNGTQSHFIPESLTRV